MPKHDDTIKSSDPKPFWQKEDKKSEDSSKAGFEPFAGDRHNPKGQRCKRCGVVFPDAPGATDGHSENCK